MQYELPQKATAEPALHSGQIMASSESHTPYREIFEDLIKSIMRAQAEVVAVLQSDIPPEQVSPATINRHFVWLALQYRAGINRHLYDAVEGNSPIRTRPLRAPNRLSKETRAQLARRESISIDTRGDDGATLVQTRPTRISSLLIQSFVEVRSALAAQGILSNERDVAIKSPLALAFDFLSVPEMPSSRAYILMTLRNYLFETYNRFPGGIVPLPDNLTISVSDVEEALSHIFTSLRERYWSSGEDRLPAEGRSPAGSILRQFLAAKGILWMRFRTADDLYRHFSEGQLVGQSVVYEFSRSAYLDHLPDLGELINELWGIPIPIRGADTLFRGGLKFSGRGGLVVGIHGGPGVGKTSLALAIGASLAPFDINTLFLTGEESASDLHSKADVLVPDELRRRLSFFGNASETWLTVQPFPLEGDVDVATLLERSFKQLAAALESMPGSSSGEASTPKPCRAVVVLDGLHDILMSAARSTSEESSRFLLRRLREFVFACREMRALVLLTTGEDWEGDRALDYLVDVAIRLLLDGAESHGRKPDRRVIISKARHQLCAIGTHGIHLSGNRGLRFSPQINYQLDRRAIWKTRLPDSSNVKTIFRKTLSYSDFVRFTAIERAGAPLNELTFNTAKGMVVLPRGCNVFLNGEGSGGKAALALKIALAPGSSIDGKLVAGREKILVVSFLYPREYYEGILRKLLRLRRLEYGISVRDDRPDLNVVHLYPGHYQPDHLFNRIEWELDAAELHGQPYSTVIIDGIHNVFLQFPEIEGYSLFFPQLYAALRSRAVTILTTHTTFVLQGAVGSAEYRLDDRRSEPLRHALVQKTDFRFEIDPITQGHVAARAVVGSVREHLSNTFSIRTVSAINQPIPDRDIFWSRESLVLFERDSDQLALPGVLGGR